MTEKERVVRERIAKTYLVPVVVLDDATRAVDTVKALAAGGVDIAEITLRTEAGLAAIEAARKGAEGFGTRLFSRSSRAFHGFL